MDFCNYRTINIFYYGFLDYKIKKTNQWLTNKTTPLIERPL